MAIEQLSYSAAEIDERLSQVSGDNLLINPFFRINQRGQSSYGNGYGLDGWAATGGLTVNVLSDGIELTAGAANGWYTQVLESPITGKEVTCAALLADGTIHTHTGVATETNALTNTPFGYIATGFSGGRNTYLLRINAGQTIKIVAAKLELGSVSTLANDVAPKPATDIAECQRYLSPLPQHFVGWASSTTEVISVVPLPTTMRTTPSLSNTDASLYRCRGNGENNIPTGISIIMDASNTIRIMFTGTFTQNEVYYIYAPPGVMLSAEL